MDDLLTLAGILIGITVALWLVFELFAAPWQVLLLLLVVGLGVIWWLLEQNRSRSMPQEAEETSPSSSLGNALDLPVKPSSSQPIQDQPLTYRGTIYKPQSSSTADAQTNEEVEISGKYRGNVWKKRPAPGSATETTEIIGKYRGCTWKSSNSKQ